MSLVLQMQVAGMADLLIDFYILDLQEIEFKRSQWKKTIMPGSNLKPG